MKLKTKVLTGLLLSSVIATGAFAAYGDFDGKRDGDRGSCNKEMKFHKDKKGHGKFDKGERGERGVIGLFKQLNLTDDQKTKIREIMIESRKNVKSTNDAFTKNSFDKAKYLEIISQQRENMLKSRAEVLEKSYALLTDKQKEQLKVLMDLKQEKKEAFLEDKMERLEKPAKKQ